MSKKKRGKKGKRPRGPGAPGGGSRSPGRVHENVVALARKNVREIAGGGMTPAKALEVAAAAHFLAGYLIGQVEAENPLPQAVACREDCDWCCYNQVEVTAPEALLLGHFVAANFSPEAKALLLDRIARALALTAGEDKVARARRRRELPCPLLVARRCAAYGVRPLTCRAMHALDAVQCEHEILSGELRGSIYYAHRQDITVSVAAGLRAGCRALGWQDGPLDLVRALHDFLTQENLVERWLKGEKVFGA